MLRPKHRRIPGHLRLAGWIVPHVHALLLENYCAHAPFAETCLTLQEAFGPWPAPRTDVGLQDAQRRQVRALAQRANLDRVPTVAKDDYQALHALIRRVGRGANGEPVFGPGSAGSLWMPTPEFPTVEVNRVRYAWRGAGESLGQLAWRIAHDLGVRRPADLPGGVYQEILDLPAQAERLGWLLADQRSALERHVRWLFLRLCPQDAGGPWRYGRIAEVEGVSDPRIVQRPVAELVEGMKIDLPEPGRGRPRGR